MKISKKHYSRTILFFIFFNFSSCSQVPEKPVDPEIKLVTEIKSEIAQIFIKKYGLKCVGESTAMPGGILNELGLIFYAYKVLTMQQIRQILVEGVQVFLQKINSNPDIRPYLENYPFTEKNISFSIIIVGPNGENLFNPNISSAWAANGKLWYATKDPNQEFGYDSEYKESYEEAERLVKQATP